MTHPIIKTDNYILITSDEEIKSLDAEWSGWWHGGKKVIAHLPLNNSIIHKGVPLLPPLPDEEDFDKKLLTEEYEQALKRGGSEYAGGYCEGLFDGIKKAKEKYKFTEEDMRKAKDYGNGVGEGRFLSWSKFIQSISQPRLPVGFKCETKSLKQLPFNVEMSVDEINKPKIYKGVMQGEWIFE